VDKSYKCYFLGIDMPTQAYKVWVVDNSEVRISSNVLFDEFAKVKLVEHAVVPVNSQTKNIKDFGYLIGMVYRDDENALLYVSSRLAVQKGDIVAFRCTYFNNVVGKEEPHPIHVADVERMIKAFLHNSQPLVVLAGDVSATKIGALQTSSVAAPSISSGNTSVHPVMSDIISKSGAKRSAETSSGRSPKRQASGGDVHGPRRGHEEKAATNAHASSSSVQSTGATSHRHPRAAHGKKNHVINIGKAEESAFLVRLNYNSDVYHLHMPGFDVCDHTPTAFSVTQSDYMKDKEKWDEADLREIKSLVLEHRVWDVRPRNVLKMPITPKWVRAIKSNNIYKSRLCGRGFSMIKGVDYDDTFSPVAKMVTVRILLTLIACYVLETASLDVKTAFLNAKMDKPVEMFPPSNLAELLNMLLLDPTITSDDRQEIRRQLAALDNDGILLLLKALYGTKEAGRLWYMDIDAFLKTEGFKPNAADRCFYILVINDHEYVLLLLYVDDIILAATSRALVRKYVEIIGRKYRISASGKLVQYLNIKIEHIPEQKTVYLSQESYIETMFRDFAFSENEKVTTPMDDKVKLIASEEENLDWE
jgi:hypothetical protein